MCGPALSKRQDNLLVLPKDSAVHEPRLQASGYYFFSCWRESHSQLGVAQSFALRITLVWAGTKGLLEGVAGPGPTPVHTAGAYPLPQLLATG